MNDRFRFRIPITNKDGKFEKFVYFDLFNQPAITCRASDIFKNTEQCTGLKDKNGRLIYEGDIVESTIATRNNKPARDVIKYNNEFAGFEPMCLYDCDCGIYNSANELLIVGNIHENTELLEVK